MVQHRIRGKVAYLAIKRCGIVLAPEDVKQLLVSDLVGVVGDSHGLIVTGPSGAHDLIGRNVNGALCVANLGPGTKASRHHSSFHRD